MSGECRFFFFFFLVQSYRNKDLKQRTSVTAQLQLRVLFSKQTIVHLRETWGWANSEGEALIHIGSLFIYFFVHPTEPASLKQIKASTHLWSEKYLFHLRFSLQIFPLIPFHGLSPYLYLSFSHCQFGILFLLYLPNK